MVLDSKECPFCSSIVVVNYGSENTSMYSGQWDIAGDSALYMLTGA